MQAKYTVVPVIDVDGLLPFLIKDNDALDEQIKEEGKVKEDINIFIKSLEVYAHEKIFYIGHEKKYGKHLERFLFQNGGFLEITVEAPVSVVAHLLGEKRAKDFCASLKKALIDFLPNSAQRQILLQSIEVKDGMEDQFNSDKWEILHKISAKHTIVGLIVAIVIMATFEIVKAAVQLVSEHFFEIKSIFIPLTLATMIAFAFEPFKRAVDKVVGKYLD